MNHDLVVSQTITINSPVEQVWNGLTNPEIIKLYLYGTQTSTDWKVGSDIAFEGDYQGQTYKDKGVVKENKPYELLSYTYWSGFSGAPDIPENYGLVTYSLKSVDANTTDFTWTQRGFASQEGCDHSQSGMGAFLEGLKKAIEEN
jgi:uncharacterized protein YndB with AHSA1/START domain